jgi:hypothetical protein
MLTGGRICMPYGYSIVAIPDELGPYPDLE